MGNKFETIKEAVMHVATAADAAGDVLQVGDYIERLPHLTEVQVERCLARLVRRCELGLSAVGYYEVPTSTAAPQLSRAAAALKCAADLVPSRYEPRTIAVKRATLERLAQVVCPSIAAVLLDIRDDITRHHFQNGAPVDVGYLRREGDISGDISVRARS